MSRRGHPLAVALQLLILLVALAIALASCSSGIRAAAPAVSPDQYVGTQ